MGQNTISDNKVRIEKSKQIFSLAEMKLAKEKIMDI